MDAFRLQNLERMRRGGNNSRPKRMAQKVLVIGVHILCGVEDRINRTLNRDDGLHFRMIEEPIPDRVIAMFVVIEEKMDLLIYSDDRPIWIRIEPLHRFGRIGKLPYVLQEFGSDVGIF